MTKCNDCKIEKCEDCGKSIGLKDTNIGWPKPQAHSQPQLAQPCLHESCEGCKKGTCTGVHMISCPCPKCSPTY